MGIETNQNRNSKKDYFYIDDAIDGFLRVLVLSSESDVFNIAYGKSYSINEIADILGIKVDDKDEIKDLVFSNISIKKAKTCLGFNPLVGIKEGLQYYWKDS